jgi:prefoldin subunit 5
MGSLDHHSDVSVVGKRKPPQPTDNPNSNPRRGNTEYMVQYYRQQIDRMQQQADQIDKQISTLQDAKNGKTVDSQRTYNPWGGVQGDWNAQIAQLQKNKDNVLQQIDSLEEALRKLDP